MAGTKGNSGGKRAGAGQPKKKKNVSELVKNNFIAAAKKLEKEKGMSLEEAALRMVYDKDTQDSVRASVLKIYSESLITKETKSHTSVEKVSGPAIGLPPRDKDPALIVHEGGKDAKKTSEKKG